MRIWDAHTGQPVGQPFSGHTDWVTSVAFSFSLHGPRVDCHQPMGGKQLPDFGELGFATHEIRQLCRKIWCNSSFGHPKRRELVAQLGMA